MKSNNINYINVGARVRQLRCAMQLTQDDFASVVGIDDAHSIARIERGARGVSMELAARIAETYGITLDWLILGRGSALM